MYRFFHIRQLLRRLFSVLFLYTLCRLIFWLFNYKSFPGADTDDVLIAFAHGIRFDISAVIYINLLFILLSVPEAFARMPYWYERLKTRVFYITNTAGLLINLIDVAYFRYQKKRTTFELFSGENDIIKLLPSYIRDFWYILLILAVLVFIMVIFYKQTQKAVPAEKKSFTVLKSITYILFIGLLVIGMRGGLQTKPIQMITASYYGNAQLAPLALNTPFTIMQSLGKKRLEEKNYFPAGQLDAVYTINRDYPNDFVFNKKNVVVIILESFSNEYIGALSGNRTYSPFLDSLIGESLVFENAFANGKKSNEAMPSIFASLPSMMDEAYTGSVYQDNGMKALPAILKQKGYNSMFFHGGYNGSMNFDAFAKKAGFDQYYGMNEFEDQSKFDGNWGIYDEPFFDFFGRAISSAPKPVLAAVFSLSSHPPFSVEAKYANAFPDAVTAKLKSYRYTDQALKKFFEYASKKKWYYNTLFVITADHSPDADSPEYDTRVSYYKVPLILFDPSASELKGRSAQIAQHVDIMPTILDYLHYSEPFKAFGESLLRTKTYPYAVNYRDGIYQIVDSSYVLQFAEDKPIALYNYRTDWQLKNDLLLHEEQVKSLLEPAIKAYIQKYNSTLIENKFD